MDARYTTAHDITLGEQVGDAIKTVEEVGAVVPDLDIGGSCALRCAILELLFRMKF